MQYGWLRPIVLRRPSNDCGSEAAIAYAVEKDGLLKWVADDEPPHSIPYRRRSERLVAETLGWSARKHGGAESKGRSKTTVSFLPKEAGGNRTKVPGLKLLARGRRQKTLSWAATSRAASRRFSTSKATASGEGSRKCCAYCD